MNPGVHAAAPLHALPFPEEPIHVLHVGQQPADVDRARHHLRGYGPRFAVDGALTGGECLARLGREPYDVLLVADRAADMSGLELLRTLRARGGRVPVVLLLRERDEQTAADAVKLGVFDYLVERGGDLVKLPLVVENAAVQHRLADARRAVSVFSQLVGGLSFSVELDDMLRRIAEATADLLRADWTLLLLLENGDALVPRAWAGVQPRAFAGVRFPADSEGWARLWSAPAPVRLDPIAVTGPWSGASMAAELQSALAVPLVVQGRRLGALLVTAPPARQFGPSEEAVFRTLAELAAATVENHSLAEQLVHTQRLSTVGRMVAGVAHEMNNPLAVITGTLDLLRHEPLADRFAERLARVAAQAQRAVRIVRTLLAFARNRPAQRTAVRLDELLTETLELAAYDLKQADVRVVRQFHDDLPPVAGDPDQLRQVFTNLILNAYQAMRAHRGEGTLTVTAELDPSSDRVLVTVADTGPGIRPEHLARVFEPFFTTKAEEQGTGLGLAICRRIVEGHGGQITVASRPGQGARFMAELPTARDSQGLEAMPGMEPIPPPASVRVLVVEDEPPVADMVEDLLLMDGHEVDRARTGREALDRLARGSYALIISDVRMPDLSGPAFYEELLRVDPALARRVVFVTGDVMSPETRSFLDQTGLASLEKPFEVADFQAAVRRALGAT